MKPPTPPQAEEARARELLAEVSDGQSFVQRKLREDNYRQHNIMIPAVIALRAIERALSTTSDPGAVPAVAGMIEEVGKITTLHAAARWIERAVPMLATLAQQPALPAGGEACPLNKHFEAMQGMCSRYLEPAPYAARYGMIASEKSRDSVERDKLFIADMIYMLDGPEQREAQQSHHHAPVRDAALREAIAICLQQQRDFLSPEYATGQPLSSFQERFACGQCADAILALVGSPAVAEPREGVSGARWRALIIETGRQGREEGLREAAAAVANMGTERAVRLDEVIRADKRRPTRRNLADREAINALSKAEAAILARIGSPAVAVPREDGHHAKLEALEVRQCPICGDKPLTIPCPECGYTGNKGAPDPASDGKGEE